MPAREAREEIVKADALEAVPLFAALTEQERAWVSRWADEIDVPEGTHLLVQGHLPHGFFVVLEGGVEIRKDNVRVAELGPGDFFGEIAIVEHDRRTASVIAATPCRAIVMHSREFEAMRAEMPTVAEQIERAIHERLGDPGPGG
jgi:CRP/FNR family transcriptional regulator, cyclic AMP receptor protein